jgi:hypothetical protein
MKTLLIMALFNIHTSQLHDITIVKDYDTMGECTEASMHVETPDENGDVKLYSCATLLPKEKAKSV